MMMMAMTMTMTTTIYGIYNDADDDDDWEPRFNDTLLINFCKSLQNLGEESVGELLMGEY